MNKIIPILLFSMMLFLSSCAEIKQVGNRLSIELRPSKRIEGKKLVKVTASKLNLRECASTRCTKIDQLPRNTELIVLSRKGKKWIEVEETNGYRNGWVSAKYVRAITLTEKQQRVDNQDKGEMLSDDFSSNDIESQPSSANSVLISSNSNEDTETLKKDVRITGREVQSTPQKGNAEHETASEFLPAVPAAVEKADPGIDDEFM